MRKTKKVLLKTIMVVEDDPCLYAIIEKVLFSIDQTLKILWVTSAEEAERLLDEDSTHRIHLVLADHYLSGEKTGLNLWETIQRRFQYLPVVVTSGLGIEQFLQEVGKRKICPLYLAKPFKPDECRQMIEAFLPPSSR